MRLDEWPNDIEVIFQKLGRDWTVECNLRLMSVDTAAGLVNEGRNLVIVALVGKNLYIRIFDADGKKVVDKAESELMSGEKLTTLKKRLNTPPDKSSLSLEQKRKIIRVATSIAGHAWTVDERTQVIEALFHQERLPKLLAITRRHLGSPPPSPEDTEDVFCEFRENTLDNLIENYDPQKGRFLAYFITALERFVHARGKMIRKNPRPNVSLDDKEGESIELILPDHNLNSRPELANECGEAISHINQCITNHLTEDQRKAFVARYFKLRSYAEIAKDRGITEANARQLCHRASVHVKRCLEESSKPGGFDQ